MILKTEKHTADELSKLDAGSISAISIENTIEREKAASIKKLLRANEEIRIVLIVDPALQGSSATYNNLDIVSLLGNIKHLSILAFGSSPLDNIKQLEGLTHLETFRLAGAYKKDMDLKPLLAAEAITELELEYGLFGKHQIAFVNNLAQLHSLKVSVLDLKQVHLNTELRQLTVSNTLKNPELLSDIFPGLKSFTINHAKGIDTFEFISELKGLESLQIGHTSKLKRLPVMKSPYLLKSLSLVNTKQFDDLDSMLQFGALEELKMTEPCQIPYSEIERLKDLMSLKRVHVVFKTEQEDIAFEKMAQERGWTSVL